MTRIFVFMHARMAYAAAVLLLSTVLWSAPAMADPSIDAGSGVAAYEAGDYARAYDLLKPAADAGDLQARYLMARLLAGDLAKRTDYETALNYLDVPTRCSGPDALAMYAYLYRRAFPSTEGQETAARAYKEAARAGNLSALANLGLLLIQELDQPLDGGAYLVEAWTRGSSLAKKFIDRVLGDEEGALSVQQLDRLVEERPFESRWPLLADQSISCPSLEQVPEGRERPSRRSAP